MVNFQEFTLDNGLVVIVNEDTTTPLVAMNILYNIGSRDEEPDKTGFAHLFEHLMFGGSINVPSYDEALQLAGGENNAFTTSDITNYYLTVPADNIETGFWLESDRMLELAFSEKSLEVQRNVVVEEFKQRYLNQPYGDIFLLLRPLAYKVHPYLWPTIGKDLSHILNANLDEVKNFFFTYYAPNNAILVLSGNIKFERAKELAAKWFGPIPMRSVPKRLLTKEPVQNESRKQEITKDVPFDCLVKAYHTVARTHSSYPATDLVSDIISGGNSSRFYLKLVKDKKMFSELDAYVTGDVDPGLLIIKGKLMKGIDIDDANSAVEEELKILCSTPINERELNKVKNKFESHSIMSLTSILNKAMALAYNKMLGDASFTNNEVKRYLQVEADEITTTAREIFQNSNCSTLYYLSKKNS